MRRSSLFLALFLPAFLLLMPCSGQDSLLLRQQLSYYKTYFSRHGIALYDYAMNNAVINRKLLDAVRNDQKAQNKLVGAGLLAALGVGLMSLSTLSEPDGSTLQWNGSNLQLTSGDYQHVFLFSAGLASVIVAFPLGISSVNHRKQRNKALKDVREYLLYSN